MKTRHTILIEMKELSNDLQTEERLRSPAGIGLQLEEWADDLEKSTIAVPFYMDEAKGGLSCALLVFAMAFSGVLLGVVLYVLSR